MTPQEQERRCLLWHRIEQLLFSPTSDPYKMAWCQCFLVSISDLWGVETWLIKGSPYPKSTFSLPLPGFSVSYDLSRWSSSSPRASVRIEFAGVGSASHDIDHCYHDRSSLYRLPSGSILSRYPNKKVRDRQLLEDIQWILDRYLLHPCVHLHLELIPEALGHLGANPETSTDILHEIRLGFGISNPFAALFQFRINFLPGSSSDEVQKRKEKERDRIAALLLDAILRDHRMQNIPPSKLFDLKWVGTDSAFETVLKGRDRYK